MRGEIVEKKMREVGKVEEALTPATLLQLDTRCDVLSPLRPLKT
jgi:hypothetical protein